MGDWRSDQSKKTRRYVWGQTRGEEDATWRDFVARAKVFPVLAQLKMEKIGSEMHLWRPMTEGGGRTYWVSCLRFKDDGWGYWTVYFRPDERRWRATHVKEMPLGKALTATAHFYQENGIDLNT